MPGMSPVTPLSAGEFVLPRTVRSLIVALSAAGRFLAFAALVRAPSTGRRLRWHEALTRPGILLRPFLPGSLGWVSLAPANEALFWAVSLASFLSSAFVGLCFPDWSLARSFFAAGDMAWACLNVFSSCWFLACARLIAATWRRTTFLACGAAFAAIAALAAFFFLVSLVFGTAACAVAPLAVGVTTALDDWSPDEEDLSLLPQPTASRPATMRARQTVRRLIRSTRGGRGRGGHEPLSRRTSS